ncbi:ABC transporter permease [Haloimpatiens sp. FM7315]|uniref:ABC transporter permease n=1 Tax=Haloimpatiens sp. FM7315 TaxID=3298609 RepID=UPI003977963D
MLKVLKNEIIKMFSSKKFYILCFVIILSILIIAFTGKNDAKSVINAENFLTETLFGMLMRPMIPMLMVVIIAETLTQDYAEGTMKFSLMAPIKKSDFIIGKFLFITVYALILLFVSFFGSYIIGVIFFGLGDKGEILSNFIYNLEVYVSIVLPLLSFSFVISFIALIVNNSATIMGLGIGIHVIMLFVDSQIKNAMYYTFSGGIAGGMYAVRILGKIDVNAVISFSITAGIYIFVSIILSMLIFKKKDIVR